MRFSIIRVGLYVVTAVIHPMWVIDEYARIFRSCVWLRPPQPPARTDIIAMATNKFVFIDGEIWYRTDKGAIFFVRLVGLFLMIMVFLGLLQVLRSGRVIVLILLPDLLLLCLKQLG